MTPEEVQKGLSKFIENLKHLPYDIEILATEEFDRNFERQSFFSEPWANSERISDYSAHNKPKGSILMQTGDLRRSIKSKVQNNSIIFSSNVPYASIHNEGGTIQHPGGTAYFYDKKKKKTIWISNRKAQGKNYKRTKPHKITIPKRQFIGEHPQLEKVINDEIEKTLKTL